MPTFAQVQADIFNAQSLPFKGGMNLPARESARIVPCLCDFSASGIPVAGYKIDVTQLMNRGAFSVVQTLYVDNSNNNGYIVVQNPVFSQSFGLPPGYQGYFPVIAAEGSGGVYYVTSTGNQQATVSIINALMPLGQWPATVTPITPGLTQPVSDAILDALVIGGRFNTRTLSAQLTGVDRSIALTLGGTAQVIMAANPARQGFLIQDIDEVNVEPVWFCTTAGAVINGVGSFSLAPSPGAGYPGGQIQGVISNAISVVAATTGHKISAIEW